MLLNLKHLWKFYFAQIIARWFTFIGFMCITIINIALYLAIVYGSNMHKNMTWIWGPVIILFFLCIFICHLFLGLFDEAVVGTLFSLAVDMDLNNGQPQFGPPDLHKGLAKVYGIGDQQPLMGPMTNNGYPMPQNAYP